MTKENLNKWITWFGRFLVLISVFFLFLKLLEYKDELIEVSYSPRVWLSIGVFSLIYGFLKFIPAYGWYKLLLCFPNNSKKLNGKRAIIVYGKTHIAKYIPGNIFHYTGRHLHSKKLDLTNSFLIKTTILEVFVVTSIASALSFFAIQEVINYAYLHLPFFDSHAWVIYIFFIILVVIIGIKYWNLFIGKLSNLNFISFFKTYLLYFLFFILNFFVFYIILFVEVTQFRPLYENIFFILGIYSLAWLLGFIVPGAPGGIGVREAVLFAILNPLITGNELLLSLFLFRLVTTLGDLIHYCYTIGVEHYLKDHKQYYLY